MHHLLEDLQPHCDCWEKGHMTNSLKVPCTRKEKQSTDQHLFILAKCMPGCLGRFSLWAHLLFIAQWEEETRALTSPALKKSTQLLSQRTNTMSLLNVFCWMLLNRGRRYRTKHDGHTGSGRAWQPAVLGQPGALLHKAAQVGFRYFFCLFFFCY